MSKFDPSAESEEFQDGWNIALEEVRDSLARKMRTEYGLTINEDKQVVDWNKIEHTLDKLKEE